MPFPVIRNAGSILSCWPDPGGGPGSLMKEPTENKSHQAQLDKKTGERTALDQGQDLTSISVRTYRKLCGLLWISAASGHGGHGGCGHGILTGV